MCKLLNQNPYNVEKVVPIVSNKVKKDLEIKKMTTKKQYTALTVKRGYFLIEFP